GECAFQIDLVARLETSKIGPGKGFGNRCDLVHLVLNGFHGQANPVMRQALVRFQLRSQRARNVQYPPGTRSLDRPDHPDRLNYPRKHWRSSVYSNNSSYLCPPKQKRGNSMLIIDSKDC